MVLPRETNPIKERIGNWAMNVEIPDETNEAPDRIETRGAINAQIISDDDSIVQRRYDLLAMLDKDAAGHTHKANLDAIIAYILPRLKDEVLPSLSPAP